jgi:DNA-binding IclR family transcriptional regulator
MEITGMTRPTLYRHLRELVSQGSAYQVRRGRWHTRTTEDGHGE